MAANQYLFLWAVLSILGISTFIAGDENATEVPGVAYVQIIGNTLENVTNCNLPNDVNASVTIGGDVIDLHLHNNDRVHDNTVTFLMKTRVNGSSILEPYTALEKKNYRLYHDKNNTASIMLKCPKRGRKSFEIRGTFMYNGSLVRLTLATNKRGRLLKQNVDREEYSVVRQKPRSFGTADFIHSGHKKRPSHAIPNPVRPTTNMQSFVRKRRQVTEIHIDVITVVDYSIYNEWYNRSSPSTTKTREEVTIDEIEQYFALVINGVDLLYEGITNLTYDINVHLVGYFIAQTSSAAHWTEEARISTNSNSPDRIDSNKTLYSFRDWMASRFPNYDHAILFTGLDMYSPDNGTDYLGLAFVNTTCDLDGDSSSLVEDDGAFGSVHIAAHEMGHSLSAYHDGDKNNTCRYDGNYIMASWGRLTLNAWKFSTCSVSYFRTFIDNQLLTSPKCLTTRLTPVDVTDVTGLVPGQLYDPDEQCRHIYGPTSSFYRGGISYVCEKMDCVDPQNPYDYIRPENPRPAARGTSCGNQRWCVDGQCVCDPNAPSKDAQCVFGDQPGIVYDDKSCAGLISEFPGYCYQDFFLKRCCQSCGAHYRSVSGCEYGDKVKWCSSWNCRYRDPDCCGTCNTGVRVPDNRDLNSQCFVLPNSNSTESITRESVTSSPRPDTTTGAPVTSSPRSVTTTAVPVTSLPTPVTNTEVPVTSSPKSITTTGVPVTSLSRSTSPTVAANDCVALVRSHTVLVMAALTSVIFRMV